MAAVTIDDIIGSVREGVSDTRDKAADKAREIADRVESALDDATSEGRRISKKLKKELAHRWKAVDSAGRDNAFVMALGALGVGILIGYLITRDRD